MATRSKVQMETVPTVYSYTVIGQERREISANSGNSNGFQLFIIESENARVLFSFMMMMVHKIPRRARSE